MEIQISFPVDELLTLIRNYLLSLGMSSSAAVVEAEARLLPSPLPPQTPNVPRATPSLKHSTATGMSGVTSAGFSPQRFLSSSIHHDQIDVDNPLGRIMSYINSSAQALNNNDEQTPSIILQSNNGNNCCDEKSIGMETPNLKRKVSSSAYSQDIYYTSNKKVDSDKAHIANNTHHLHNVESESVGVNNLDSQRNLGLTQHSSTVSSSTQSHTTSISSEQKSYKRMKLSSPERMNMNMNSHVSSHVHTHTPSTSTAITTSSSQMKASNQAIPLSINRVSKHRRILNHVSNRSKAFNSVKSLKSLFSSDIKITPPMRRYQTAINARENIPEITLPLIVEGYLRQQHMNCPFPVSACPPFSLLKQHCCPLPALKRNNITTSILRQPYRFISRKEFYNDTVINRNFYYNRWRCWRTVRESERMLTCTAFATDPSKLWVGSADESGERENGGLILYDLLSYEAVGIWTLPSVTSVACSPVTSSPLLLTTTITAEAALMQPVLIYETFLWKLSPNGDGGEFTTPLSKFPSNTNIPIRKPVFSPSGNRLGALQIGPVDRVKASVFDLTTLNAICSLDSGEHIGISQTYRRPCITFGIEPGEGDNIVVSDGILWDCRVPTIVHRFDRLSTMGSTTFHPNGNELIIDSAIWDLRQYALLRTVPLLESCQVRFKSEGDVMIAFNPYTIEDLHAGKRVNDDNSVFHVLDGSGYTAISKQSVDRDGVAVYGLDLDTTSGLGLVAVTEAQLDVNGIQDSWCRVLEPGKRKPDENDSDAEEEDSEGDEEWEEVEEDDDDVDIDEDDVDMDEDDVDLDEEEMEEEEEEEYDEENEEEEFEEDDDDDETEETNDEDAIADEDLEEILLSEALRPSADNEGSEFEEESSESSEN